MASYPAIEEPLSTARTLCIEREDGGRAMLIAQPYWTEYQTSATLSRLGWASTNPDQSRGWRPTGLLIPEEAFPIVESYINAGTGPDSISTKMPFLVWLVFMEYVTALELIRAIGESIVSSSKSLPWLFANDWCRQILLERLPALPTSTEAERTVSDDYLMILGDTGKVIGVEGGPFVMNCLRGQIENISLTADIMTNYSTLTGLLQAAQNAWPRSRLSFDGPPPTYGSRSQTPGPDQLMRDTLKQLADCWGRVFPNEEELGQGGQIVKIDNGGAVNRKLARRLFMAMGGLSRSDE